MKKIAQQLPEPPKKAVVYARTSKDDPRSESKISIVQQCESAQKMAKNEGMKIVETFIDQDQSGKIPPQQWLTSNGKYRDGLTRLIKEIEKGGIDAVICRKTDRLSRNLTYARQLYDFLANHKVRLYCTHETLPAGRDASGIFGMTILAAVAEFELGKTQENIKAAKAYAREHGLKMSGVRTPGYKDGTRIGGKPASIEIDEEAANTVREIFRRYDKGESISSIVRWCNQNHPTHCSKIGNKWYVSSVRRMLDNPSFVGLKRDENGDFITALYPQIVDDAIFWRVSRKRQTQVKNTKRPQHTNHLLTGALICGYCHNGLVCYTRYRRGTKIPVGTEYKCPRCRGGSAPFVMRESKWMEWFTSFFGKIMGIRVPRVNSKEITDLEILRSQLMRKIEFLEEAFDKKDLLEEQFIRMNSRASGNLQKVTDKISAIKKVDLHSLEDLSKMEDIPFASRSFSSQRNLVKAMVEKIEVYKDRIHVFTPLVRYFTFPLMYRRDPDQHCPNPMHALTPCQLDFDEAWKYVAKDGSAVIDWGKRIKPRLFWSVMQGKSPVGDTKLCLKCGIEKPLNDFSMQKRRKDKRQSQCKSCEKEYRLAHAEHMAAYKTKWRELQRSSIENQKRL